MLIKRFIQSFFGIVGIILGFKFGSRLFTLIRFEYIHSEYMPLIGAALGGILLFSATTCLVRYAVTSIRWIEMQLLNTPLIDIFASLVGTVVGLSMAYFLSPAIIHIPVIGVVLQVFISTMLGLLGFRIGLKKREDLVFLFAGKLVDKGKQRNTNKEGTVKILDTSVIIDGRIADIVKAGFLEGSLVVPSFVLQDLQHIADSSDDLQRKRGRRGLDILNQMRKKNKINVNVLETDFEEAGEMDSKLIRLAKQTKGKIVTNDPNLFKVCELQQVGVLNINDLSHVVKPVVLPGEEIIVQVAKNGKEDNQGVGFLEDGTMIVIEGGKKFIGTCLQVVVTSIMQTAAGRMIFAKPKFA